MIRVETEEGWLLICHQDHARLAGAFACEWGSVTFPRPEPFEDILVAVSRHDDAWASRDSNPLVTPDGTPSAFSKELVGTYSAFENIDLEAYLKVRGQATDAVASDNPLAAILISMHTVNLLTEQADLSTLGAADREMHRLFIEGQRNRQEALYATIAEAERPSRDSLARAFRFLQACDSFSLITCVRYPEAIPLRHAQETQSGDRVEITCTPERDGTWRLHPYCLGQNSCTFSVPAVEISGKSFPTDQQLQAAYRSGRKTALKITVHP